MKTKGNLMQICLLGTVMLRAATFQSGAQTAQNPGFETPNVGAVGDYYSFQYNPTGAGWTFTDNAGIAANGSGFAFYNAGTPDGNQFGFLQVYQGAGGSMFQTLSNLPAGNYSFSFIASQRDIVGRDVTVNQTATVLLDDLNLGSFTPADPSWYSYQTIRVPLTAGNHVLTFTNLPAAGDGTIRVDDVAVLAPAQLQFNSAMFDGTNVVFGGSNSSSSGVPGLYCVLSSTDATLPLADWTIIAINSFDANGGFSFTNAIAPSVPGLFFAVELPPVTVANLSAGQIGASTAIVTWTTSDPATGQVNWGYPLPGDVTNATAQSGYLVSHSVTLMNLAPLTLYSYTVSGYDQAGSTYQSSSLLFRTMR